MIEALKVNEPYPKDAKNNLEIVKYFEMPNELIEIIFDYSNHPIQNIYFRILKYQSINKDLSRNKKAIQNSFFEEFYKKLNSSYDAKIAYEINLAEINELKVKQISENEIQSYP